MFLRNKKINHGVKKIDKIITGIIIGGAIFGLTQTKKGKEITNDIKNDVNKNINPFFKKVGKQIVSKFGKGLASFVGIFSKKK